jgi:hypothetical protein
VFRSLTGQLRNTAHLLPLVLSIVALVVLAIALRGSLLVLLLPFAGAAMFHGWFGSASGVYLFAAGTVAAFAAYWLGLWALLRVAEPSMASLVAAALVVVPSAFFAARRHTKLSDILGRSGRSWWWACVIFAVVFASIYVSSTPLVEFSETRIFHIPLVASMSRGNVPPINLSEPPNPLYYHYGQHVFAATLHTLSGLPAHLALFVTNGFFAGLAAVYAFTIGQRSAGTAAGIVGALLMVGAGTLNWLSAIGNPQFAELMTPLGAPFTTGNIAIGAFAWRVHGNSMAWAMCIALLSLDLMDKAATRSSWTCAVASGVALAVLAPANETLYCSVAVAAVALPAVQWIVRRRLDWCAVARAAALLGVGIGMVFLTGGVMQHFFAEGSTTHGATAILNWGNLGTVASWDFGGFFPNTGRVPMLSWRFLQDVGPVPFLAIPALVWSIRGKHQLFLLMLVAGFAALAASSLITLTMYPANTFRLVNLCVVLCAIPVGAWLIAVATAVTRPAFRRSALVLVATVVTLSVVNWPLLHLGVASAYTRHRFPPLTCPQDDVDGMKYLRDHTPFDAPILSIPHGNWAILGSGQASPFGSWVGGDVGYRELSARATKNLDIGLMSKLRVRYLYVDRTGTSPAQTRRVDELATNRTLREVWRGPDGHNIIYEIVGTL